MGRLLLGVVGLELRAALVADAVNDSQVLHPLIEFFVYSAEGAPARQRQIHTPEKRELHRSYPESLAALGAADGFVQDAVFGIFNVIR